MTSQAVSGAAMTWLALAGSLGRSNARRRACVLGRRSYAISAAYWASALRGQLASVGPLSVSGMHLAPGAPLQSRQAMTQTNATPTPPPTRPPAPDSDAASVSLQAAQASTASAEASVGAAEAAQSLASQIDLASQAAVDAAAAAQSALLRSRPNVADLLARPTATSKDDVSMKARVIFEACWKRVVARWGDAFVPPREVVWLNGAPGSGKGTNTPFIIRTRGLSHAVSMSQLLDNSPEIKALIDRAELVPDAMVLDALLEALLSPEKNSGDGLIIDGFPRTALQVDFVKLLHDKLTELSAQRLPGGEARCARPSFKVVILYVDEEESVRRQSSRAKMASLHNARVMDAGTGDMWDVRTTDASEALCRRRYQVFKAHYMTILRLKQFFPFSLIDAMGTPEECRAQIARELRYQSSLDLDAETYAVIRDLPLARDLVRTARQRLVSRLDKHCREHRELFVSATRLVAQEIVPLLSRFSLAGHVVFRSRDPLLAQHPAAPTMVVDILSDRGFAASYSTEHQPLPLRVDLSTGEILMDQAHQVHVFRITFDKDNVRDLSTPQSVTTRSGEDVAIGATYIPMHLQREDAHRLAELQASGLPVIADIESKGGDRAGRTSRLSPGPLPPAPAPAPAVGYASSCATPLRAMDWSSVRYGKGSEQLGGADKALVRDPAMCVASEQDPLPRSAGDEYSAASAQQDRQQHAQGSKFLKGWESMDAELSGRSAGRSYGFDQMNERED